MGKFNVSFGVNYKHASRIIQATNVPQKAPGLRATLTPVQYLSTPCVMWFAVECQVPWWLYHFLYNPFHHHLRHSGILNSTTLHRHPNTNCYGSLPLRSFRCLTTLTVSRLHSVCDRMINEYGIGRGNRSVRRKAVPVPLCPLQIPQDLSWDRTREQAGGSR